MLPTDTVYGLVCAAFDRQPSADLYRLKGRDAIQPTAILTADVEVLIERIPELDEHSTAIARALLPARRFGWLTEGSPDSIGVRVPALTGTTAEIVKQLGVVVATSANLSGGPDPRRLAEVPAAILAGVAAVVDGGALPGTPSTVIDVTGPEPLVLRAGAGDPGAALERIAAARG